MSTIYVHLLPLELVRFGVYDLLAVSLKGAELGIDQSTLQIGDGGKPVGAIDGGFDVEGLGVFCVLDGTKLADAVVGTGAHAGMYENKKRPTLLDRALLK